MISPTVLAEVAEVMAARGAKLRSTDRIERSSGAEYRIRSMGPRAEVPTVPFMWFAAGCRSAQGVRDGPNMLTAE